MPYQELVPFKKIEIKAVNAYVKQRDMEYPNLNTVIGEFNMIIVCAFNRIIFSSDGNIF